MTKSVGFFLAVFGVGLLGLLLVSGDLFRWIGGGPEPDGGSEARVEEAAARPAGGTRARVDEADPNEIRIPVYDVVKGRLEYTFRGRLDEKELSNLGDIQEIKAVTLRDGVLEVPIYEDVARDLPPGQGDQKARRFTLTFASAEYTAQFRRSPAGESGRKEREREVVVLRGDERRGRGTTDDGTEFRFEELVFTIDRTAEAENYFTIRSEKPVGIKNGYLTLESPRGLEGRIFKNQGLQKLVFFPPVRTYLDPRAGRLFSMGDAGEEAAGEKKGEKNDETPEVPQKVAITCAGPMSFLLDTEPRTIRFEKDVTIFPVAGEPEPGREPKVSPLTRFQCQLLVIEVDSTVSPPRPSRALATWEGGRVQAHYHGKLLEGDRLVWSLLSPEAGLPPEAGPAAEGPGRSEAVLSGTPTLTGDEGRLETGEVVFRLDEDRILLRDGLKGEFRAERPASERSAKPRKEREGRPAAKLPGVWDFQAGEGELSFARADAPGASASPTGNRVLKEFVAHGAAGRDLEIRSRDGGRYRLTGRTLRYDAPRRTVSMEGPADGAGDAKPRFHHDRDQGSARSIRLLVDEGLVALREDVAMVVQDLESLRPKGETSAAAPEAEPTVPAPAPATPPTATAAEGVRGPVEILADEVDLRFDAEHRLLGAEARSSAAPGAAGRPATLRSIGPEAPYRLGGRRMAWDQRAQTAEVEGEPGLDLASPFFPRLEHEGGTLLAEKVRFDRKTWRVSLLDRVAIHGRRPAKEPEPGVGPPAIGAAGADGPGDAFEIRAGRAEVDLVEDLRPLGRSACGSSRELALVRQVHAWAPQDGSIELHSATYRGKAREAVWSGETQELHVFGGGRQEIVWIDGGRESTVTAEDIVYRCPQGIVVLSGNVRGEIRLEGSRRGEEGAAEAKPAHASHSATQSASQSASQKGPDVLAFHFETGRVEARVREGDRGLQLVDLRASEKVLLTNDRYRLKLTGDNLHYDHDRRELRVYSEDGRFQTLTHGGETPSQVDQIDSREIGLWYRLPAAKPGGRAPAAPAVESVVVKFRDDVNATFHASDSGLLPAEPGAEAQRKWKLQSEHLGILMVPGKDDQRLVRLALAEGNVIFSNRDSSGDYMAMAPEAFYEESAKKVTLEGDKQNPARMIFGQEQVSYPVISVLQLNESRIRWKREEALRSEPPGLEELRRGSSQKTSPAGKDGR